MQKLSASTLRPPQVPAAGGEGLTPDSGMELLLFSPSAGLAAPLQGSPSLGAQLCGSGPFSHFPQRYSFLFLQFSHKSTQTLWEFLAGAELLLRAGMGTHWDAAQSVTCDSVPAAGSAPCCHLQRLTAYYNTTTLFGTVSFTPRVLKVLYNITNSNRKCTKQICLQTEELLSSAGKNDTSHSRAAIEMSLYWQSHSQLFPA